MLFYDYANNNFYMYKNTDINYTLHAIKIRVHYIFKNKMLVNKENGKNYPFPQKLNEKYLSLLLIYDLY